MEMNNKNKGGCARAQLGKKRLKEYAEALKGIPVQIDEEKETATIDNDDV